MRILHTSDWHLGKRLFKLDRSEEHKLFLDWLVSTLIEKEIDLLLIAGDIFDTPTPPHYSLEMFYEFLHRVSTTTKATVLIIAGNHDSGQLLEAPAKILAPLRIKVWGKLSDKVEDHWFKFQNLNICSIPFFRSYELLPHGDGDALVALEKYLTHKVEGPKLLMLHHLAGMFEAAGSEQVISLSGVDSIPSEILKSFDYVALGHIHKPQRIGENMYYSGSPLPLRFSETARKSIVIIDEANGVLSSEVHPIPVFRDLFIIKTAEANYKQDIEALALTAKLPAMAEVQIKLDSPKIGLIDDIKERLQKKGIELLSYLPLYQRGEVVERKGEKLFEMTPLEIFTEFYQTKYPDAKEVPADLTEDFKTLLEKVKNASHPS